MSADEQAGLLDLLPVSVARLGADLRFTWASARLCRQIERPLDEIVGRTSLELGMTPASWGDWAATVAAVFATGRPAQEYHFCNMPVGERLMSTRFAPIPGPDGRPAEVVAVAFVDDEVRRLRDALAASERRFQTFMDHLPIVAWLRDADGHYLFVNREYLRVQQLTAADIVGKHVSEVYPAAVADRLLANDTLSLAGPLRTEEHISDARGQVRPCLNMKFAVPRPNDRAHFGGIDFDLSEERRQQAMRRELDAKLLQAQKVEALGLMAAGVAHDFNNILTSVLGFAGLGKQLAGQCPPAVLDCFAQIETAAERAAELCQQMLAYTGNGTRRDDPVDLSAVVRETVRLLAGGHLRGVTVVTDLADLPPVTGDPTQLRQVVMNLLTNAAEATIGQPTRTVTVATAATAEGTRLTVHDTGTGIDPATVARMFEPFFTTKATGRGLGLAAVDGIVRGHGGTLRVTTAPGAGSTFEVILPATATLAP